MAEYIDVALPIVNENGTATLYFENYLYGLAQDMGGEGGNTPVDTLNLLVPNTKPKINEIGRGLSDSQQIIESLRSSVSSLSVKLSRMEARLKDSDQLLAAMNQFMAKVAPKINAVDLQVKNMARMRPKINAVSSGLMDAEQKTEALRSK